MRLHDILAVFAAVTFAASSIGCAAPTESEDADAEQVETVSQAIGGNGGNGGTGTMPARPCRPATCADGTLPSLTCRCDSPQGPADPRGGGTPRVGAVQN